MNRYYFFKTDNITLRTIIICNGSHEDVDQCKLHFRYYMYGFMDGAFEILGAGNFKMDQGSHPDSFRVTYGIKHDVEYFMLLDQEGVDLLRKIA